MDITKHLCGKCGKTFTNELSYLKHVCQATGFSPRESKHFNLAYKAPPEKALPKSKIIYLSEKTILEAVKQARPKQKSNG